MTAPQPTTTTPTEPRPALILAGSDHPYFRAGARIAARVERGRLIQLGVYAVHRIAIDRVQGRVVIQTAQDYLFVATAASYDALLAMPEAQAVPLWAYTDRVPRVRYFAKVWQRP